jgi:murein DD-endopeptidase MepM/ murein hydrolase activator NlpD
MLKYLSILSVAMFVVGTGWHFLQKKSSVPVEEVAMLAEEAALQRAEEYPLIHLNRWQLQFPPECADTFEDQNEGFVSIVDGQTLHDILRPLKVSLQEIHALSASLKPFLLAKDLAADDLYKIEIATSEARVVVKSFSIRKLDQNRIPRTYVSTRADLLTEAATFTTKVFAPEIIEATKTIRLQVKSSLFATFKTLPFGVELMQRVISLFAWRISMPKEVHNGDQIELLVTEKYVDKKFVGYGQILSAFYRQNNREFSALYFTTKDKKVQGFYDHKGKSLEKELLLSPVVEATHTSSQKWRLHPVRKIRIRHNGIDFRGPIGTPFFAIGDGVVVEKRFDKNVGNMVRIRHKYGVYSEYFHADSLANTYEVNQTVKRGQIIGTIGRTGRLCTGPHLHLGTYRMAGEKRVYLELASLKNTLKFMPDISKNYRDEFDGMRREYLAKMSLDTPSQLAGN